MEMGFLAKPICQVWRGICGTKTGLHPKTCLVNIWAGTNLIHDDYLKPQGECLVNCLECPKFRTAAKKWLKFRVEPLIVQMGDLHFRVLFGIGQSPELNVLFGTKYKDKCIRRIFPMESKMVPEHLVQAVILGGGADANVTTILSREAHMDEQNEHATLLVAKHITILGESDSPVVVVRSKYDLMTIERIQAAYRTQRIFPPRDIHKVRTNVPFRILLTHFSIKPAGPRKNMCIALGTSALECILEPEWTDRLKSTIEINEVHYKEEDW